jgi:hypothetical protein
VLLAVALGRETVGGYPKANQLLHYDEDDYDNVVASATTGSLILMNSTSLPGCHLLRTIQKTIKLAGETPRTQRVPRELSGPKDLTCVVSMGSENGSGSD